MIGPTDETAFLDHEKRARPVPWVRRTRTIALPSIVALSLLGHALILIALLYQMKKAAPVETETPVEIIQEPPAKKDDPKKAQSEAAKSAEEKSAEEKAAQEKAAREKAEQQAQDQKAKADQAKQDQAAKEQAARDQAAKQQAAKEQAARDQAAKEQAAKDQRAQQERARQEQQAEAQQAKAEKAEQQAKAEQAKAEQTKQTQARVAERMRNLLPGVDAAALPGESADGTESATYQQLVLSRLTKALSFDRHRGNPGFAVVTFVLGDRGEVASVTLDRPSGDPVLDHEAIAVVRRGAPYPVPPPGGKRDYTVTLESRPVM